MVTQEKIYFLLVLIIGFGLGFVSGQLLEKKENTPQAQNTGNVPEVPALATPGAGGVSNGAAISLTEAEPKFFGKIGSINNERTELVIEMTAPALAGASNNIDQRVVLNSDTKVYRQVRKDQETILRELGEFQKKVLEENGSNVSSAPQIHSMPPAPFTTEEENLSVLEAGQTVNIVTVKQASDVLVATRIEISDAALPVAPLVTDPAGTATPAPASSR